ncbi:acyltransferase [Terrimonas alba]|uniref:acyltransferase n=1 Tax=Terrimonas alba TaxID=3349636 RepID=UPI0035F2E110
MRILSFKRIVLLNFIVGRIFGVNNRYPYSVHYTSKLGGAAGRLVIEDNSTSVITSLAVSGGCYIQVHEGTDLYIGKGTLWAPNITIVTGNHDLLDRCKYHRSSISIGRNCWLATGVVILPGVKLGNNVTVAANAVVNKSFPDNVVIGGVPARIIKHLDN